MRGWSLAAFGAVALVVTTAGCAGGVELRGGGGGGFTVDGDGFGGSAEGSAVVTDELVNIASDGGRVVEECGGRNANVVASGATVTLNGSCALVTVAGSDNHVSVGSAAQVNMLGSRNVVHYTAGEPDITDLGSDNTVAEGDGAAP